MEIFDRVSAILTQKGSRIWSISPEATVYDALSLMAEKEIGSLLVLDGDRLAGLLSERDYARKIILRGRASRDTRVDEIMISNPVTVSPDTSIDETMRIMTDDRIRHVPVVGKDGAVLGLVSIGDVVKWIITSHEKTIEQLQSYIAGTS
jgi:CBS domain-containing protein